MLLATNAWSCFLVVALVATGIYDALYRRVPNAIVLTVLASGMLYWGMRYGLSGIAFASMGVAAGLFFMLGFYILGWLGAGDVKIFAAFGGLLGAYGIVCAGATGLFLGGILSLLYLDKDGPRWHLLPAGAALRRARETGNTVPLGAALAAGVLMVQLGFVV